MSALWHWQEHLSMSHAALLLLAALAIGALAWACYQDLKHGGRP